MVRGTVDIAEEFLPQLKRQLRIVEQVLRRDDDGGQRRFELVRKERYPPEATKVTE